LILLALYFEMTGNFFTMIWIVYVFLPLLDYLLPIDNYNLNEAEVRVYEKDWRFLIPIYISFIMDITFLMYMLWSVSVGRVGETIGQLVMYAFCSGQVGALNAVIGHELVHKRNIIHKICGTIAYAKMMYGHFFIQHIRSHHKKVSTPEDPSTARMGESLYQFYWRAIPEGYVEVWDYEVNRLKT
jgi:alkane 1-monooxygenase